MQARKHTADTPMCLRSPYAAQQISAKQSRRARVHHSHRCHGVCPCACFAEISSAAIDLPRHMAVPAPCP